MKRIKKTDLKDATQDSRVQMAINQSAMHTASLAVARWTSGYTYVEIELARALSSSSQQLWYATAQSNFTAWLAAGGFAQPEPEPLNTEAEANASLDAYALPGTTRN